MSEDTQKLQQESGQAKTDENVLPPDLQEEVNALRKKVDTLESALESVVKKPQ